MNLNKAMYLTLENMEKHGLNEWTFKWNNATTIYGQCDHIKRVIILSKILTKIVDEAHVLDTILHEIAHALVGPGHKHNSVWKAKMRELGGQPNASCNRKISDEELPPKWVMVFDNKIVNRWMRRPNKSTFIKLPNTWVKGRKDETYGKLEIMPYEDFKNANY